MEGILAKGNINYKYLRRRKNWFQRNWGWLVAILTVAIIVTVIILVLFVF